MPTHPFRRAFVLVAVALSVASLAPTAQARTVPTPQSVLGFEPTTERTIADWTQITGYFSKLDAASERVKVQEIGKSTLGRPLIAAFISAPENIRNLEKYRRINARLADPRTISTPAERDDLLKTGKVIVAISCSIHSTEIVASQMSLNLAYQLASAQDAETREILQNTILLLLPSPNPDGIDIVAKWYRQNLGTKFETSEPPELYHHYAGHDDNRDWFMLSLRETQHVTRFFWQQWFPEIVYDIHQKGQTGFINSAAFEISDSNQVKTVARYAQSNALLSGWMLGEAYLNGKVALAETRYGAGKIVLFAFRPQHRGQTFATFPLLFNALEK